MPKRPSAQPARWLRIRKTAAAANAGRASFTGRDRSSATRRMPERLRFTVARRRCTAAIRPTTATRTTRIRTTGTRTTGIRITLIRSMATRHRTVLRPPAARPEARRGLPHPRPPRHRRLRRLPRRLRDLPRLRDPQDLLAARVRRAVRPAARVAGPAAAAVVVAPEGERAGVRREVEAAESWGRSRLLEGDDVI